MTAAPADRMPPIGTESWTDAQRTAAAALMAGPRGEVRGPFVPLLRSPELLDRAQTLGEYLRYRCQVPEPLREFAILVVARHWRQGYEWHAHARLAARTGTSDAIIAALAQGVRPAGMSAAQSVVYEFITQLQNTHAVDDACYAAAHALLGEAGVVDLTGMCGYYTLLAMVLNVARTPVPGSPPDPFA